MEGPSSHAINAVTSGRTGMTAVITNCLENDAMTISAERREELEDELAQATEAGKGLMVVGTDTFRTLLHDSARLERIERQVRELIGVWTNTAHNLEFSNGATACDKRVSDSIRSLRGELRAIVDTGDEEERK